MKKTFNLLLIFVFSAIVTNAQQSLSGKVFDAGTHKPIALANVFLSNTSVGTITDDNGTFTIQRFPDGRYELIVSCIGYETFIVTIQSGHLPANLVVKLKPKVEVLNEVIVEPYEKNGWEKWGSFFMENFIGLSSNAANCKFVNKEVVKFRHSKKEGTLKAFADEPLVLINNALGYTLKYSLTKFEYNFNTKIFFYQGYPLFEEMDSKRARVKERWIRNRESAYHGSLMHFMRSLYRNTLIQNNFEVRKLIKLSDPEKARVKAIYQNQVRQLSAQSKSIDMSGDMGFANADSANYYKKVMRNPEDLNVLINQILPGDSIAYALDSTTVGLDFTHYLYVTYLLKKNPEEYAKILYKGAENAPIISEISLTNGIPVTVLANGSYFEGVNMLTSKYWGWWEKLGNMLPYDYWPPVPKKNKR